MRKRRKKLPEVLNSHEAAKLLSIPNPRYPTGQRNLTILTVMLNMGLRVSEVSNLKPGSINLTEGKLRIGNGKGGVDRDLTIPNGYTSDALMKWKKIRPKGKYFFTTLKGGKVSTCYMHLFVKRYVLKAGINKKISPHTLRHTTAMHLLQSGVDITVIALWLGHESPATTHLYVEADLTMKEKALQKLQDPSLKSVRYQASDSILSFLESL